MATVKLKQQDLQTIIDVTLQVVDYKQKILKERSLEQFEVYLEKLYLQIKDNAFNCNRSQKNTLLWIIDQIKHSKLVTSGLKPEHWTPLEVTTKGRRAIEICQAAARGQFAYDPFTMQNNYKELFKE